MHRQINPLFSALDKNHNFVSTIDSTENDGSHLNRSIATEDRSRVSSDTERLGRTKRASVWRAFNDEQGSQIFEYIAILPMLFIVALIGWQFFLAGHTFIVTANAAREGARTLAVCGGGDVGGAVQRTSPGYSPRILQASRGGSTTTVVVGNEIPKVTITNFINPNLPLVRFRAVMRTEKCR